MEKRVKALTGGESVEILTAQFDPGLSWNFYIFTIDVLNAHDRLVKLWLSLIDANANLEKLNNYVVDQSLEDDIVFDLLNLSCLEGGYKLWNHYPQLINTINSHRKNEYLSATAISNKRRL